VAVAEGSSKDTRFIGATVNEQYFHHKNDTQGKDG
jgi:hypothetical protein